MSITDTLDSQITNCDILLVDSKYFKPYWSKNFAATLERVEELGHKTKLIWCDQADSTGTFLGQVLPHVHKYLKAQHLKDKTDYKKTHYASRIYTDYYHRKYGITDKDPYIDQPVKNDDDIHKIGMSWNSGLMNYGMIGPYLPRVHARVPLNALLRFAPKRERADAQRANDITCRMGVSYARDTVSFQRKKMREALSAHLPTDKLSRRAYFKEMQQSKICVSPFGLGEITLKDFECFLTGALLLKPDMSHMTTWPNFYQEDKTCIFHDWDMQNLEEKIDWVLNHEQERIEIARNAQELYTSHTTGKDAGKLFADHFQSVISA
ncbi:MAG: glycosyltransferase [Alphaproteobacteria bacterium]